LADTAVGFSCVSLAPQPGVARLALSGELDLSAAPRLGDALSNVADDAVLVILDLSELTFMDSSGLHTILTAHARLRGADRRLVLVPGQPAVQRIFELTRTDGVLEFVRAPDDDRQPWNADDANPV
jgi:anti-sigma B factor antagonist